MRRYNYEKQVEKWDVLEVTVEGHSDKNPFVDYEIQGIFTGKHEIVTVDGFYDGEGVYKVRYMPSFVGLYTFEVTGSAIDGEVLTGKFQVTPVSEENHGPIRVANILPTKTERRIIPSAQPVMCGQSAVSDAAVKRYFAPEKEASLLLCEEHHREQWRFLNWQEKGLFFVIK